MDNKLLCLKFRLGKTYVFVSLRQSEWAWFRTKAKEGTRFLLTTGKDLRIHLPSALMTMRVIRMECMRSL